MKRSLKWISFLLAIMLLGTMLVGCGNKEEKDQVDAEPEQQEDNTEDQDETKDGEDSTDTGDKITDKPVKFTYWSVPSEYVTATTATLGETELYKELENRTGVEIEFLHPPMGQDKEQFNLMIASDELPDLIEYTWFDYPGGLEKALQDGVIIELNELIDSHAPNLKKLLESDEEIDKVVKTDSGKYYMFPFIRGEPYHK